LFFYRRLSWSRVMFRPTFQFSTPAPPTHFFFSNWI
jgi:hypothetical protein